MSFTGRQIARKFVDVKVETCRAGLVRPVPDGEFVLLRVINRDRRKSVCDRDIRRRQDLDPDSPELVTVRYYQDYNSNNYTWHGWKEQLWREHGEQWRIVYEGNG